MNDGSPPKIYDDWKEARKAAKANMKVKAALKKLQDVTAHARPFPSFDARGQKRELDDDEDDKPDKMLKERLRF